MILVISKGCRASDPLMSTEYLSYPSNTTSLGLLGGWAAGLSARCPRRYPGGLCQEVLLFSFRFFFRPEVTPDRRAYVVDHKNNRLCESRRRREN